MRSEGQGHLVGSGRESALGHVSRRQEGAHLTGTGLSQELHRPAPRSWIPSLQTCEKCLPFKLHSSWHFVLEA